MHSAPRQVPVAWRRVRLDEAAGINPESLGAKTQMDFSFGYIDVSSVSDGNVHWGEIHQQVFATTTASRSRSSLMPHPETIS